jgi:hypothetical protein
MEVVHRLVVGSGPRDLHPLLEPRRLHELLPFHRRLHQLDQRGLALERHGVVVGEALRLLLLRVLLHLARVELADEHLAHAARLVPELLALAPPAVDQAERRDDRGHSQHDPDHLQQAAAAVRIDVHDPVEHGIPQREQVPAQDSDPGHD